MKDLILVTNHYAPICAVKTLRRFRTSKRELLNRKNIYMFHFTLFKKEGKKN